MSIINSLYYFYINAPKSCLICKTAKHICLYVLYVVTNIHLIRSSYLILLQTEAFYCPTSIHSDIINTDILSNKWFCFYVLVHDLLICLRRITIQEYICCMSPTDLTTELLSHRYLACKLVIFGISHRGQPTFFLCFYRGTYTTFMHVLHSFI